MTEKVYIAEMADLPLKMGIQVKNGTQPMAIFKMSETKVYAIGNTCPHRGGSLSEGMVTGEEVICPLHSLHIQLATGQPISDEVDYEKVPTYETIVESGKLYVMV